MSLSSLLFARLRPVVYRRCRCTRLDMPLGVQTVRSVVWLEFEVNRLFSEYLRRREEVRRAYFSNASALAANTFQNNNKIPSRSRVRSMNNKKLVYNPAERNKDPILQVLKRYVVRGTFLEIASGSGQHVAHFASHLPQVVFQPSDKVPYLMESIEAHSYGIPNIKSPICIDVTTNYQTWGHGTFQPNSIDYIYNANMIHISPYRCTVGLFDNAGLLLKPNGLLIMYGPYAFDGQITPQSNVIFDKNLRQGNSEWGLRDVKDLKELAKKNNITLVEIVDMPANNKTIIWRKCAEN